MFSERREPLFHPRNLPLLGNCQAIVMPYDGSRSLAARRCYLKSDFLPGNRPYRRAREAEELETEFTIAELKSFLPGL